jgi:hypothetical protein
MMSDAINGQYANFNSYKTSFDCHTPSHQSRSHPDTILYSDGYTTNFYDPSLAYDSTRVLLTAESAAYTHHHHLNGNKTRHQQQQQQQQLNMKPFINDSDFQRHDAAVADSAYASLPVSLSSSPFSTISSSSSARSSTTTGQWDTKKPYPVSCLSRSELDKADQNNGRIKRKSRIEAQASATSAVIKKKKCKQQNDENKTHHQKKESTVVSSCTSLPVTSGEEHQSRVAGQFGEPKKRVSANKKERRRTQSINNAFADLRDRIPQIPTDTKLSKIKTLKLATDYIEYLMKVLNDSEASNQLEPFKPDLGKLRRESRIKEIKVTSYSVIFDYRKVNPRLLRPGIAKKNILI